MVSQDTAFGVCTEDFVTGILTARTEGKNYFSGDEKCSPQKLAVVPIFCENKHFQAILGGDVNIELYRYQRKRGISFELYIFGRLTNSKYLSTTFNT